MVYITTSRKPSAPCKRLAAELARVLRGERENRGKRSVQEVLERAERKGHSRCLLVYEKHGNPSRLCFLERDAWLPSIVLKGVEMAGAQGERRLPGLAAIEANGKTGQRIAELFEPDEELGGQGVQMLCSDSQIYFELRGNRVGPLLKIAGMEEPKKLETEGGSDQ